MFWKSNFIDNSRIHGYFLVKIGGRRRRTALSVSRFCPDFPENPVRCLSAVRILFGFSVRCLSFRPDRDKTELSGLSLSSSADVWLRSSWLLNRLKYCAIIGCINYILYMHIQVQEWIYSLETASFPKRKIRKFETSLTLRQILRVVQTRTILNQCRKESDPTYNDPEI